MTAVLGRRGSVVHTIRSTSLGEAGKEYVLGFEAYAGHSFPNCMPADKPVVVVDYAHTPDGLQNILSAVKAVIPKGGRMITVFGCGGDRDVSKRPKMGRIAETMSDLLVVTSDNPRTEDPQQIITDILAGIERFDAGRMQVNPDRLAAIHQAIDLAKDNDVVVVAGKGHEDYQILADRTIHFDDRQVVQEYLKSNTPV